MNRHRRIIGSICEEEIRFFSLPVIRRLCSEQWVIDPNWTITATILPICIIHYSTKSWSLNFMIPNDSPSAQKNEVKYVKFDRILL